MNKEFFSQKHLHLKFVGKFFELIKPNWSPMCVISKERYFLLQDFLQDSRGLTNLFWPLKINLDGKLRIQRKGKLNYAKKGDL